MVSVCLSSDALFQHLPSYLGFSYLGRGVSLHGCSSKAQPLLLTLDQGYLLTTSLPDLQRGIAPLGPPAPVQPRSLDTGLLLPAAAPDLGCGVTLLVAAPDFGRGVAPLRPFLRHRSLALLAAATDLGRGVTPFGRRPSGMGSSRLLPLTSNVG